MNIAKRGLTIALLLSLISILLFGQMNDVAILAVSVGTLLLGIGVWISYRPAAVFGFMTLAIGSGMAVEVSSLTDSPTFLSAVVGILVPVYVIGWVALSSEIEGPIRIELRSRATYLTILYTVVAAFSVPIFAVMTGLFAPQLSTHISVVTEAAVMLLVIAIAVIVMTARGSRSALQEPISEPSTPENA